LAMGSTVAQVGALVPPDIKSCPAVPAAVYPVEPTPVWYGKDPATPPLKDPATLFAQVNPPLPLTVNT